MKYALLADVHSNLEALTAVLAAARAEGAERIVCLGDLVGYHADPGPCLDLLRDAGAIAVAGNHDRAVAGISEPDRFGLAGRRAIHWTRAHLSEEHRRYLAELPLCHVEAGDGSEGGFLVVHAALHPAPNADVYLATRAAVRATFAALRKWPGQQRLAFFGHTHHPVVHELHGDRLFRREGSMFHLARGRHHLVNPGSVGQSRDDDPRAAFAIFDAEARRLWLHRTDYDREACLAKARAAGLLVEPPARTSRLDRLRVAAMKSFRRLGGQS